MNNKFFSFFKTDIIRICISENQNFFRFSDTENKRKSGNIPYKSALFSPEFFDELKVYIKAYIKRAGIKPYAKCIFYIPDEYFACDILEIPEIKFNSNRKNLKIKAESLFGDENHAEITYIPVEHKNGNTVYFVSAVEKQLITLISSCLDKGVSLYDVRKNTEYYTENMALSEKEINKKSCFLLYLHNEESTVSINFKGVCFGKYDIQVGKETVENEMKSENLTEKIPESFETVLKYAVEFVLGNIKINNFGMEFPITVYVNSAGKYDGFLATSNAENIENNIPVRFIGVN